MDTATHKPKSRTRMTAIEKLKHIDKGMTNIIQWDAVSGDLLRQMCAWQKELKLAIHELKQDDADKERLDWLDAVKCPVRRSTDGWKIYIGDAPYQDVERPTLREAVDAAKSPNTVLTNPAAK